MNKKEVPQLICINEWSLVTGFTVVSSLTLVLWALVLLGGAPNGMREIKFLKDLIEPFVILLGE